jgi:hypothetical protein
VSSSYACIVKIYLNDYPQKRNLNDGVSMEVSAILVIKKDQVVQKNNEIIPISNHGPSARQIF